MGPTKQQIELYSCGILRITQYCYIYIKTGAKGVSEYYIFSCTEATDMSLQPLGKPMQYCYQNV